MLISRSIGRKVAATAIAAVGFVLLYEVTALDSRFTVLHPFHRSAAPESDTTTPGSRLRFTATAYCKGTTTASGVNVRTGIAAADPDLLPVGSVISVEKLPEKYNGVYTVMDTGPKVQGRHIDIYMWSCYEALDFGRRNILLTVLRLGWNPKLSRPGLIERLFHHREATAPPPPPATPPPLPSHPIYVR
jgi:3D (Asp-Asp-Asp) domain-containing protein